MAQTKAFAMEGFSELEAALRELPANVARRAARKAVTRAGEMMADEQRRLAPVDDGQLRGSITVKVSARSLTGLAEYRQSLEGGGTYREASAALRLARREQGRSGTRLTVIVGAAAPHAHLVEFGTEPRQQESTGRYTGVMPAHPFIRPAFDAKAGDAAGMIKSEIATEIEREKQRLARKAAREARRAGASDVAEFSAAVFQRLIQHAPLSAIAGDRVYPVIVPPGVPLPYLRYQVIGGDAVETLKGSSGLRRTRLQLDAFSQDYDQAGALMRAALTALKDPHRSDGISFGHAETEEPRDLGDDREGVGFLCRKQADLMMWWSRCGLRFQEENDGRGTGSQHRLQWRGVDP